ncbi:MAG: hypothetical protein AAF569_01475 [Pseudomonadota bacterium]
MNSTSNQSFARVSRPSDDDLKKLYPDEMDATARWIRHQSETSDTKTTEGPAIEGQSASSSVDRRFDEEECPVARRVRAEANALRRK